MRSVRCCSICARAVRSPRSREDYGSTWFGRYRGIYFDELQSEVVVTGVSVHNYQEEEDHYNYVVLPKNPNHTWEQPDHDHENQYDSQATEPDHVILGFNEDFVFHTKCWALLERAVSPHPIPLLKLYDACRSLPVTFQNGQPSWGHDYGGSLLVRDAPHRYPWEDLQEDYDFFRPTYDARADPLNASESQVILEKTKSKTICPPQAPQKHTPNATSTVILFQSSLLPLPPEICLHIGTLLPTADALNARLASKSFVDLFYHQNFWASRFTGQGERSWFFEAQEEMLRDWGTLYYYTRKERVGEGLKNRAHIWLAISVVLNAFELQRSKHSLRRVAPCQKAGSSLSSLAVSGYLWDKEYFFKEDCREDRPLQEGCFIFYYSSCLLPKCSSIHFTVYFIQLGDAKYICGLQLSTEKDEKSELGYQSPLVRGETVQDFQGLVVAVGARGIQALQLVSTGGAESPWLGDPKLCPRTRRLADLGGFDELQAVFDGYKLTALDASGISNQLPNKTSLRDSAMWYPDIPLASWCLNEDAFWSPKIYSSGFQPLFWSHFGGCGGSRLGSLTCIRGITDTTLRSLYFFYDSSSNCEEADNIGRHPRIPRAGVYDFSIDGPGGERIESVEIWCYPYQKSGLPIEYWTAEEPVFRTCKIYTNKGRSCVFSCFPDTPEAADIRTVCAQLGMVITGFYAEQMPDLHYGMTAFGVITEPLKSASHQTT